MEKDQWPLNFAEVDKCLFFLQNFTAPQPFLAVPLESDVTKTPSDH